MYSNTAYEALFTYIGLKLHSTSIDIITSHEVFAGLILFIFGVMFFFTSARFFSRYMPGFLIKRRSVPLSQFFRIIACLILGIALLNIESTTSVKRFDNISWHQNQYITKKLPGVESVYRVSFIYDILSTSAEEIARYAGKIVDSLFAKGNSQLNAPNFFFKAIQWSAAATIEDTDLRDEISFYTDECFDKVLPLIESRFNDTKFSALFNRFGQVDSELSQIPLSLPSGRPQSCLELKLDVRAKLLDYARAKVGDIRSATPPNFLGARILTDPAQLNLYASKALVNHYLSQRESSFGIAKGSQVPGTAARITQYLSRLFSGGGLASLLGQEGAFLAGKRSLEFSENLQRAPHVAGFVKMVLIMIFPWLIFLVVAGRWKVLIYWFSVYLSVLLWTPIWTLFYHIITNIALSAEVMQSFGKLSDGISLYSSMIVTSRINYLYSVYSWIQLIIGPGPTLFLAWYLMPLLRDSEVEQTPEFVDSVKSGAISISKVVGA